MTRERAQWELGEAEMALREHRRLCGEAVGAWMHPSDKQIDEYLVDLIDALRQWLGEDPI